MFDLLEMFQDLALVLHNRLFAFIGEPVLLFAGCGYRENVHRIVAEQSHRHTLIVTHLGREELLNQAERLLFLFDTRAHTSPLVTRSDERIDDLSTHVTNLRCVRANRSCVGSRIDNAPARIFLAEQFSNDRGTWSGRERMPQNRVVVITGAAGGIGSVLVQRFLENKDRVVGIDNNAERVQALDGAHGANTSFSSLVADVAEQSDYPRIIEAASKATGQVDVLVNCAGYFPVVPFEQMSVADWHKVLAVNLTGTFLMCHSLLPLMKTKGWGRIVNFSSASIFEGVPRQTHYVAAKAGVVGLSRSLAMEVGQYGIRQLRGSRPHPNSARTKRHAEGTHSRAAQAACCEEG